MLPVIAIVGRPNVGKSTFFNRLTGTRQALMGDAPGLTRDRQYAECALNDDHRCVVIDTGGLDAACYNFALQNENIKLFHQDTKNLVVEQLMAHQTLQAVMEADVVLFLVSLHDGLLLDDYEIGKILRKYQKKTFLIANKIDGVDVNVKLSEFYVLGFPILPISAERNLGMLNCREQIAAAISTLAIYHGSSQYLEAENSGIKVAFIGKPNVGKSTLINRILGKDRMVVFDEPGTTRDSIYVPFTRQNRNYTLIDTAGVRKKRHVSELVEKFSIIKTLRAIEIAHVVLMLIDARTNLSDQDLSLLGFVVEAGKALVIVVNKWDNLELGQRQAVNKELERRLAFVNFSNIHFISALHGTGVGELFNSIDSAYRSATCELKTPELTRILEKAVAAHAPPMIRGRRIKLRYAHPGGSNPPLVIIHGNQLQAISNDYRRYLAGYFRNALKLEGTPVKIEFKKGDNPYVKKEKKDK